MSFSSSLHVDHTSRSSGHHTGSRRLRIAASWCWIAIPALLAACDGSSDGNSDGSSDGPPASRPLAQSCPNFAPSGLPHNAIFAQTELREEGQGKPRACIVRGTIKSSDVSTITWAVELPEGADWNGKTLTVGGGGFDGFIPTDDVWYHTFVMGPSSRPFVRISSNSGHDTRDFSWGADETALRNHAYEANHLVLEVGVRLASQFYGKTPTHRYMVGHSNGGRSALMAAGKYPNDYDGLVAMAPAISQQAHQINLGPNNQWIYDKSVQAEANWISPAKSALFAAAEIKACDSLDGLEDGVISNAEACSYDPSELKCADDDAGIKDDTCLTTGQIEAIRLNYDDKNVPIELANGMTGYERYGRGGAATGDWQAYAFGTKFDGEFMEKGFSYIAPTSVIRTLTGDDTADSISHDPLPFKDKWQALSNLLEPKADLSQFGSRGKLLVWYGLTDTCVSVYRTARFLAEVRQDSGDAQFNSYARFVTSPGVGHDLIGPGAARVDLLKALVEWVEGGTAPDNLVAAKADDQGIIEFERPLCQFPAYPHYNGDGDPKKASSFTCKLSSTP
jgi:hypothetical protein